MPFQREPTVWQVAAGSAGRDYTGDFLKYGMAFVGGSVQIAAIARVQVGDVMILKRGMSEIAAVGYVVNRDGRCGGNGDKEWLKDFDGWFLPAYCYVEWHVPAQTHSTSGLTRATIQQVNKPNLRAEAAYLLAQAPLTQQVYQDPRPTRAISDTEILDFLVREGLRPSAAEELTTAFRRIRLLASYYYGNGPWEDVREHETRTFLIMPLLLALGWAEQQIKIELGTEGRKRIDVACFRKPYRRDANGLANSDDCVLILESKGFSSGLNAAPAQARDYAHSFPSCRVLVVTNGYCYKAYVRASDESFAAQPSAYLNLLAPHDRYPLDPENVGGALEVLRILLPQ